MKMDNDTKFVLWLYVATITISTIVAIIAFIPSVYRFFGYFGGAR